MDGDPPTGTCLCGKPVPPRAPFQIDWCDECLDEFVKERDELRRAMGDSFDEAAFQAEWVEDRRREYRERASRE